ncbi:MAG: YihY/virulence factor BrkB family protein [Rhodoblastus sp.]|uniref:YihY/virulence factor BrkB family protein n=1 Tax=Rhodoblastus sp. TaxID=1962975 RepID=UPI003F985AC1
MVSDRFDTARANSHIVPRGWSYFAGRVYGRFNKDRIQAVSAGVAFYGILAIFPAIAALVAIYSLAANPGVIDQHVNDLHGVLPDGALEIIGGQVKRLAQNGGGALGFTAAISLLLSLWSANSGVKAVFDALNIAYEADEKRSFFQLNLQSLGFTLGALTFMALALTGIVVMPILLQFLGLDEKAWYIALLRWPALLLIVMVSLAALYRFGPSREKPEWRWVTWGSAVAALLWLAVSGLFSWYVANFGSYNATYGSLGAVIGFMTWMWISAMVVLLGAELDAELERAHSARDNNARTGSPRRKNGDGPS